MMLGIFFMLLLLKWTYLEQVLVMFYSFGSMPNSLKEEGFILTSCQGIQPMFVWLHAP